MTDQDPAITSTGYRGSCLSMPSMTSVPVIDLFSGPGGLSEGFSRFGAEDWLMELAPPATDLPRPSTPPTANLRFHIALSIEKDPIAHRTLTLRAFFRQFEPRQVPEDYYDVLRNRLSIEVLYERHPRQAAAAQKEAWCAALGDVSVDELDRRIQAAIGGRDVWCLIGGPPCQAYSLAGRSRNKGVRGYVPEQDHRHFLYQEYLRIVARHAPPVFVMENVKGILSSTVAGTAIFNRILEDLSSPGRRVRGIQRPGLRYDILPFVAASDANDDPRRFVLRAEQLGIPQARHRVILLGIREDVRRALSSVPSMRLREPVPSSDVLSTLPRIRSAVSGDTGGEGWIRTVRETIHQPWYGELERRGLADVAQRLWRTARDVSLPRAGRGAAFIECTPDSRYARRWYLDDRLDGYCNHESRSHMAADLERYAFAACFAAARNRSPDLADYPLRLLPHHSNVRRAVLEGALFSDRFRVQLPNRPSTTVTSHISKDGHYYIHPDPLQCRSLTVREAARLQTFPDNYYFCGPRTQQFHQVGNAVPPLLAVQLASTVASILVGGAAQREAGHQRSAG